MSMIADAFSSRHRPVLRGVLGAVSAADPLAVGAALEILAAGGNAVDAAIAAQAVLCVVAPNACGLGGDALVTIRAADGATTSINGTGAAPASLVEATLDGAGSVTVPGIVSAWEAMHGRWGSMALARLIAPAVRIARKGFAVPARLAASTVKQRQRLLRGGAAPWALMRLAAGERFVQPEIAALLEAIGTHGAAAYYRGAMGEAIARTLQSLGGAMSVDDLAGHETPVLAPVSVSFRGAEVAVQPPVTQGVILAMALAGFEKLGPVPREKLDHAAIELTEAAFAYRDRACEGAALLAHPLPVDLDRASLRGGPRAYLHTAGVSVADRAGMVVSSLISVFDDFGSAVFVPEGGFVLNDRAAGFTAAPNDAAPGKRPVHTLAPALVAMADGALGLSTPGADGQVQTLLQVLAKLLIGERDLAAAIDAPRWRSEGGKLLIEPSHPAIAVLAEMGHAVTPLVDGEVRFGGVVCAGHLEGTPVAVADWRRTNWAGVI